MAKGIFTTKVDPPYDDIPEIRYHFPKTYLNYAKKMIGDWIIYYEPGRGGGRKSYFATAQVEQIVGDKNQLNHFYALVSNYLEFDNPVHFRIGSKCIETALMRADGSLNRGAFQRSVRLLPENEYQAILQFAFAKAYEFESTESSHQISEKIEEYERPILEQMVSRPFRDVAFTKKVRQAYNLRCAMSGLKLLNGLGHAEIEAAHIRPVGKNHNGPDSIRNGIALSRTMHWMFDRGVISLSDDYDIMMARNRVPKEIKQMMNPGGKINLPIDPKLYPHPQFLKYHRDNIFIG